MMIDVARQPITALRLDPRRPLVIWDVDKIG
jgi:hypothetical protein